MPRFLYPRRQAEQGKKGGKYAQKNRRYQKSGSHRAGKGSK